MPKPTENCDYVVLCPITGKAFLGKFNRKSNEVSITRKPNHSILLMTSWCISNHPTNSGIFVELHSAKQQKTSHLPIARMTTISPAKDYSDVEAHYELLKKLKTS